jgi:hypothetical protein
VAAGSEARTGRQGQELQMIEREQWYCRLDEALGHLEDRAYQARSWRGGGPDASSMAKAIRDVFDDAMLMDFVALFRGAQMNLATRLRNAVDRANAMGLGGRPPDEVLDHPAWVAVREIAAALRSGLASREKR